MPLEDILACPVCQGALDGVRCTACGRTYERIGHVLDLTPVPPPDREVRKRWPLWEELQANGEYAYEYDPPSSLSVGERDDASAFGAFSDLSGRVLDVGCGPQRMPSYALGFNGELFGIDPLLGQQPRDFEFVKGVAEYLPFRDQSFDRVLFATSIDHALSPLQSIAAAARVTKSGGVVSLWVGKTTPPTNRPGRIVQAMRQLRARNFDGFMGGLREAFSRKATSAEVGTHRGNLKFEIPRGAIDPFHIAHPTPQQVIDWLSAAGLEVEAIDEEAVAGSCLIRARS